MTRTPGELLREVATALTCFASTKHAQAHVQRNPAIKAEMLLEVDRIEALEREVRDAAQAQATRDKAVLLLLDLAQEAWNQWAFRADDGSLWDGGLSTLERLEGILGPLGLLNHDQQPVPHPALSFDYADDETIIEVGRVVLAQAKEKRPLRSVGELIAEELRDPEFAQHYAQAQAGAGSEGQGEGA